MWLLSHAHQLYSLTLLQWCVATPLTAMATYSLRGSNPRPMAHKTIALTTELRELCDLLYQQHTRMLLLCTA